MRIVQYISLNIIIGCVVCIVISCRPIYHEIYPNLIDGKYDSEFPYRDCSAQLAEISSSVKMISSVAYYRNYLFPLESKVTLQKLQSDDAKRFATKEIILNRSSSGTATVLFSSQTNVLLLTCAHVISFPETLITYYLNDAQQSTPYIHTISYKERQSNYVAGIAGSKELDILVQDSQRDVALVGTSIMSDFPPMSLHYPFGHAKELEWGSFVYVFGYPAGQCIVTKAIVSNPNKDKSGAFLIDAVVNRGFSGGLALAVRDGVPNFEVVGMVRLVAAKAEYYLSPTREGTSIEYDPDVPYTDDVYINRRLNIEYGVTQVISSESILDVLKANQTQLQARGYHVSSVLSRYSSSKDSDIKIDSSTKIR
ncbi:MAG TPA: serine protease [Bacteroidota bacterium]|nr:serine protease [Bacteroidota bacterium]